MSVFSLKIDIADNKFFNGETSPLFSQSRQTGAPVPPENCWLSPNTALCAGRSRKPFWCEENFVKDESKRFGLNAFKMLGGAYAIAQLLCEKYHLDIETLSFEHLKNAIGEK